ncbi:MAG: c-type cytochrome [Acidobacteria bacterium]|nr:c-type cytochrome [Acidobacteriota bacterium]
MAAGIAAASAAITLAAPQGPSAGVAMRGPVEEGADMYRGYCAPCHGAKGIGDGPVAAALQTKPTDLTRLAAANQGQFPAQRVAMVLDFGVMVPAHGSTDMPTWGSTFRVMGDEATVRRRITALTRYLETIQKK